MKKKHRHLVAFCSLDGYQECVGCCDSVNQGQISNYYVHILHQVYYLDIHWISEIIFDYNALYTFTYAKWFHLLQWKLDIDWWDRDSAEIGYYSNCDFQKCI